MGKKDTVVVIAEAKLKVVYDERGREYVLPVPKSTKPDTSDVKSDSYKERFRGTGNRTA